MKATVVQIKGKYAVLLQENGTFIKMRNMNLKIGDVMNKKEKNFSSKRKFGSMVAAALFAVLIGGGVYTYGVTSYHVSLDVNPGITMEVNRYKRVIALEATNIDAEEVLEGLELENKDIEDAMFLAVERITELGYFDEEGGNILISTIAEEDEKALHLMDQLEDAIKEELEENGTEAEVISKVIGYEMVQAAREFEGITPGKYNLIVNLLGADPEHVADYADTSIKEIMKAYQASKDSAETIEDEKADFEEKSYKQEEKLSEKADKREKKAADQAERKEKNAPADKGESDSNSINSDKKNTEKISEKKMETEKEKTNESLKEQKKLEERNYPEGTDDKGEQGISIEPEKVQKNEIPEVPEQTNKPENIEEPGKPEIPAGRRP